MLLKVKNTKIENYLLFLCYAFVFVYLIFQDAIYTPDTYSYLNAEIQRYPGYALFSKLFTFLFGAYFNYAVIGFQLLIGLISIHFFYKKVEEILSLNYVIKLGLLLLLLFPFFEPLYVANNICSEGLSYPLYLFFLTFSLDFLFLNNNKSLVYLSIASILLSLTRGQFIIIPLIIAFIYLIKHKKSILKFEYFSKLLLLLSIPFVIIIMDKSYHKLKDNKFASTPFTYVNTSSLAFYVSKASDSAFINNEDYKNVFIECHQFISKNKWIMSSKERASYDAYYKHFHKRLTKICNYTLHTKGTVYFLNKDLSIVESRIAIESTAKQLTLILIKNNFNKWINLYFASIKHGFKSNLLLFFIVGVFLFSLIKIILDYQKNFALLFLLSCLTLTNAMLVAFASYSIMRLLFYNYVLIFLIFIVIYNLFKERKKNI